MIKGEGERGGGKFYWNQLEIKVKKIILKNNLCQLKNISTCFVYLHYNLIIKIVLKIKIDENCL